MAGGTLVETIYFIPKFRKIKNTIAEAHVIKIWTGTGAYYAPVSLVLLLSGIILTLMGDWGFFQSAWLGFKQGIMLAIIPIVIVGIINANKTNAMVTELIEKNEPLNDLFRKQYKKTRVVFDIVHLGVLINVILAVWRF